MSQHPLSDADLLELTRWNTPAIYNGWEQITKSNADKHGFLVIAEEDQRQLLDAVRFMDANECHTMITAARKTCGMPTEGILDAIDEACADFSKTVHGKFPKEKK